MPEARGSVPGSHDDHQVTFYGLSTCVWCKRTRKFLEEQDIQFDFTYVDLLEGQDREEVVAQIRSRNPSVSFPTIVIDDEKVVVGYRPEEVKEALQL